MCLADGSQFKYGTFDESCTDNICDTLTIDTNGKKGPNKEGKDRFTMNLTPNGVKALGESESCRTGLDCGAYILAHHKLFSGPTCREETRECDGVYNVCTDGTETKLSTLTCVTCNEVTRFCDGVYSVCSDGTETKLSSRACAPATVPTGCSTISDNQCTISTVAGNKKMTKMTINVTDGPNAGEKEVYVSEQIGSGYNTQWADAAGKCPEGTHLPDRYELSAVATAKLANPSAFPDIPSSGTFWSSSEKHSGSAYDVDFSNGTTYFSTKDSDGRALCLGN
ncbi:DUF1566 domain-containing protein [bacterium]|nr:DUF1566 domain-containing protein [bacterium]